MNSLRGRSPQIEITLQLTCVRSGIFTFTIGGCGGAIIVSALAHTISKFVQQAFLYKKHLISALEEAFVGKTKALDHTPVVLVYSDEQSQVKRVQITYGPSSSRPWRLEFPECSFCGASTSVSPFNSSHFKRGVKGDNEVHYECRTCWRRTWAVCPAGVQPFNLNYGRFFYIMPYPPPPVIAKEWLPSRKDSTVNIDQPESKSDDKESGGNDASSNKSESAEKRRRNKKNRKKKRDRSVSPVV